MSPYPFKWVSCPPEVEARRKRLFEAGGTQCNGVQSDPWNIWMPKEFMTVYERVYNFEVRPDDVWILTYPKCGTTWTQVSTIKTKTREICLNSIFLFGRRWCGRS